MLRKLFVAFVLGSAVGAAGLFGITQVVGGNDATHDTVAVVTASPTHTFEKYQGGPLGTVVAPLPKYSTVTPSRLILPTPVLHPTIPYPGNGGGPTLCNDGSVSNSSGPGTCSHHGGIAR